MLLYKKSNKQDKKLYLTFDDGPNPYATPQILDALDDLKIKVAFFLEGKRIKGFPEIVKEIYRRGHIIGNHTFDHPMFFALCSVQMQKRQVEKVDNLLIELGIKPSGYFRPPNAMLSKASLAVLSDYTIVGVNHWVFDNAIFSSSLLVYKILNSIKNRGSGILVLHDGVYPAISQTRNILCEALKLFIPALLSEGYQFSSLDELRDSDVVIPAK